MDERESPPPSRLALRINYWTDYVGTFDPSKVMAMVKRAFPETIIDWTDHQEARLKRALEAFAQIPEPRRESMVRSAWHDAWDNGPTFRFEIPCDGERTIKGQARRYSITFEIPDGVSGDMRDRLKAFLSGLQLGQTRWEEEP